MRNSTRIMLGIGSCLSGGLTPLSLFSESEQGFWYDYSDFSTLFQDRAGTTPVTAVGQPVGLVLDKRLGLVPGPELVTNGTFDSGTTGWTGQGSTAISAVAGAMVVDQPVAGTWFSENVRLATPVLAVGRTYRITFDARMVSGTNSLRLANNATAILDMPTISATFQTFTAIFTATTTNTFSFFKNGITGTFELDNITVREIPGNHATQSTAGSRPVLARLPFGGRRNLLTYTEQFDNAAWTKAATTITANSVESPNGTMTADTLTAASGAAAHNMHQSAGSSGTAITMSIYAKAGTNSFIQFYHGAASNTFANFDLAAGAVGTVGASSTASIASVGDGWYRCTMTCTPGTASTNRVVMISSATSAYNESWTATGTETVYLWGAQLEAGSTATAYQKVVASTDVTETGKADCYCLRFDGVDDFLVTSTITPGVDKAQVFAGLHKGTDAAVAMPFDFGNLAAGSLAVQAPASVVDNYQFAASGSIAANATAAGYAAPVTNVLAGLADIAGDRVTLRVDGTQVAEATSDLGTGNFLAFPAYIGRRAGTSRPLNGDIYSMIVRFGANLTADQINATERYVAGKMGVVL